ncbi:Phosphopantetheine attachment site [Micromonospora sp. MW-13]|uniref:acyl carrier protein n=1 Tax=Micromonospora sp. MW-13 TaxID=2094022 RepID=UPI000E438345|nr:acyl carrier protein [Micromonospora sp. MW-13]RGC66675.1 Phosphopantetheine attachment site [Micromonospora sp. MW-13]
MGSTELRARLAALVSEATGGDVPATDVLGGGSLVALGVDSLGLLRLVDAIELEYGVEVELTDPGHRLDTLDDLMAVVAAARPDDTGDLVDGAAAVSAAGDGR